jgi:hypothetical protein
MIIGGLELAVALLEALLQHVHVLLLARLLDIVLDLLHLEGRGQGAMERGLLDQYEVVEDHRALGLGLLSRLERARWQALVVLTGVLAKVAAREDHETVVADLLEVPVGT